MQESIKQCLQGLAPILPVIKVDTAEHILPIAEGLLAGGIGALEITLRTEAGLEAIGLARKQLNIKQLLVNASAIYWSILTSPDDDPYQFLLCCHHILFCWLWTEKFP